MGIRVKKVIGYGLTDLTGPEDDRINPDGYLGPERSSCWREVDYNANGYYHFLKKHGCAAFDKGPKTPFQDMMVFALGTAKHRKKKGQEFADLTRVWDPCDSVFYDDEFGMSNVLVVVPFCMAVRQAGGRWVRRDDVIDYCEETHCYGQQRRVVTLSRGIHPWDCDFEDEAGEKLEIWEVRNRRTDGGFVTPTVPMEVRALCYYLELFKSPETAKNLEPLLYVYWA